MRQVRRGATGSSGLPERSPRRQAAHVVGAGDRPGQHTGVEQRRSIEVLRGSGASGRDLQRQAWQWAEANRAVDGSLPSGREIARQYGRHERWGRLVKRSGCTGEFATGDEASLHLVSSKRTGQSVG